MTNNSLEMAIEVLDVELQTEQLKCIFNALDDSSNGLYELLGKLIEKRKEISKIPADITYILYDFEVEVATKKEIGDDISYRQLIKSVKEAEKFNYQSDYWGSADEYKQDNVNLMESVENYIGGLILLKFEDKEESITFKLLGVLIDKMYSSLKHTVLLVEEVE